MIKFILRIAINAFAIWLAAQIITGMTLTEDPLGVAIVALVFGLINAMIRPAVMFLGTPFIIVTLGIFALVINSALLGLTAWLTPALTLDGFWPAFWGALIVSLVSWFLSTLLGVKKSKKKKR